MKKIMTLLSMIALAIVGTTMIGCSNKEYDIEKPEQSVESENVITLTTTISFPDAETDTDETKALDIDYGNKNLSKTFKVGEKMAVLYKSQAGGITSNTSAQLKAEDITNGGKTAKFTITVYSPVKTENLTYVYPAAMVGGSYPNYHIDYSRLNTQDGTLASIASDLDLATFTGPWDGDNLPSANLTNELAIIAYTLKNADGVDITSTITGMTINDGTNNYTVNRSAAAGPIYVAIRPTNNATINYTATDGITNNYKKTVSEKTYEAGQFYQLGLKMASSSSADGYALKDSHVGDVVGSDGLAYAPADRNILPAYASVAGMVAYKDGENGLVIALSNESGQWWSNAVNAASTHTPAVTGHIWRMPKLAEWKQMFAAFGGNEASCAGLNTALANIGGTGLQSGQEFWTSTKTGNTSANYVKIGEGSTVTYYTASMDHNMIPRACIFFGYDRNAFSVSLMTKVTFAPGNLKYTSKSKKWEFLSNSWEYDGDERISQYFIWTDVFDNYNYSTVSSIKDEIATSLGSTSWRGLSTEEWRYLMGYDRNNSGVQSPRRSVAWHRYAVVVDYNRHEFGSRYLLLFPDGFKESDWNTSTMGTKPTEFEQNGMSSISYSVGNFSAMKDAGIVILPPAGEWYLGSWTYGDIWEPYYRGEDGLYWSSTCADATGAMSFEVFSADVVDMEWKNKSEHSLPVRLVKNVE